MQQLKQFDDRILQLKRQKEQAETKLARALFKKMYMIFGKDLDLNLLSVILDEVWTKGNVEKKETWLKKAGTFSKPTRAKAV